MKPGILWLFIHFFKDLSVSLWLDIKSKIKLKIYLIDLVVLISIIMPQGPSHQPLDFVFFDDQV